MNWLAKTRWLTCLLVLCCSATPGAAVADEFIWEYSPYRIQVWLEMGPGAWLYPQRWEEMQGFLTQQAQ